MVVLPQV